MSPELLAAVLLDPDDDGARRALGRHREELGDPQGELVRLQLEDADLGVDGLIDGVLVGLIRKLLAVHGATWAAPVAGLVDGYAFHRGLVGEVTLALDRYLDIAPDLYAVAPIQHVNLTAPATRLASLFGSPHVERLVSISLAGLRLGDDGARLIAAADGPRTLRWLSLAHNGIGTAGVEALAAARWLADLPTLDLSQNPCDPVPHPAARDLDGRITAVETPALSWQLTARHGPRAWLANPETPDAWPIGRDAHRRVPPKLARTNAEAHLYMSRRRCACGSTGFSRHPPLHSDVTMIGGDLASRHTAGCAGCVGVRRFTFRLPARIIQPPATGVVYGGEQPSELLDPGEWLAVAEEFARSVPAGAPLEGAARHRLESAVAAIDEVGKFVPAGAAEVPASAFVTRAGRAVWEKEPGRFRLVRLNAVRGAYADLLRS